jgi:N-ethylmaleimide reductase
LVRVIRNKYQDTLIIADGFEAESATRRLREGLADLIAFDRKFIANLTLPERLRIGAPLNKDDPTTYCGGEKGYAENPSLAQDRGEQPKACIDQRWR